MLRSTAREIAIRLSYEMNFADQPIDELLKEHLTSQRFQELREEDPLYAELPNEKQLAYITRLVKGVALHRSELDSYIEKYAVGWKFARIPMVAAAIMRIAMYEVLYMDDIPNGVAINEALELCKKYESDEVVKFTNGILGTFIRKEV